MNKEYIEINKSTFPTPFSKRLNGYMQGWNDCLNSVLQHKVTDVAPVVHGKWKFWDGWIGNHDQRIEDATCSECGYVHPTVRREQNDKSYKDVLAKLANYCPNCGTDMRGSNE